MASPAIIAGGLSVVSTTDRGIAKKEVVELPGGHRIMRVEYDDAASVSCLSGYALGWNTNDINSTVTTDISRSTSTRFAGFALGSLSPTNKFGWMLISSPDTSKVGTGLRIKTDGNVAAAGKLVWQADKVCTQRTSASNSLTPLQAIGFAFKADSGSILTVANINGFGVVGI